MDPITNCLGGFEDEGNMGQIALGQVGIWMLECNESIQIPTCPWAIWKQIFTIREARMIICEGNGSRALARDPLTKQIIILALSIVNIC